MPATLKILAPVDLARNAEAQTRYAIDVAELLGGDLTLLHVVDSAGSRPVKALEWPPSAMATLPDGPVRRIAVCGPVAETVAEYAEDTDTALVVVTSRHHDRWARLWSKSEAAEIVALARCPVIIAKARASADAGASFRRILCVVSLDGSDDAVVRYADALAARTGGELHLLHVLPRMPEALFMYSMVEIEHRRLAERSASRSLKELAQKIGTPHSTSLLGGSAYPSIERAARKYGADLVVTGRPPLNGRPAVSLDVRTLVSRLPCPKLSVPTGYSEVEFIRKGVIDQCLAER